MHGATHIKVINVILFDLKPCSRMFKTSGVSLSSCRTLKEKSADPSETLVLVYQTVRRHTHQGGYLCCYAVIT